MGVDIPDEARALIDVMYDHVQPHLQHSQRLMVSCAQEGAEAAAPHIARAAQVQILREMAERAERRADQVLLGTNVGGLQRNMHLAYFDEFHARIRELEQPIHALECTQGRRTDLKKESRDE